MSLIANTEMTSCERFSQPVEDADMSIYIWAGFLQHHLIIPLSSTSHLLSLVRPSKLTTLLISKPRIHQYKSAKHVGTKESSRMASQG